MAYKGSGSGRKDSEKAGFSGGGLGGGGGSKSGGGGGGGGLSGGGTGMSTKERNLNALDALRGGKAQNLDPATGKSIGPKGRGTGFIPKGLIPPFSRQKVKPTKSRPPTPGNITTGVINALAPGLSTVLGSEEVTGVPGGAIPGLGFEGPIGEAERIESDPSQLGEGATTENKSLLPPPPGKKKKNNPLGNIVGTLLADAGGTLVAG